MRNISTGILIVIVLGLFIDAVHLHREVRLLSEITAMQTQNIGYLTEVTSRQNDLIQANWRDIEAISSHVMVWAEVFQERPGVK